MNTFNSYLNCGYSHEVQVTPTKAKTYNKSYKEYISYVESLAINYVKSNRDFDGNSVLSPIHTLVEVREISKLKEIVAKTRVLPYQDSILINSTPISQNISTLLKDKYSLENYSYVNKLISSFTLEGIFMINFTNFVITLNPKEDFTSQREILFKIADTIQELNVIGIAEKHMDNNDCGVFYLDTVNIIFSAENLGYDITEEEYKSSFTISKNINNELIVLTAKDLGFDVKFLFKDSCFKTSSSTKKSKSFVLESDDEIDNILY